MSRRQIAIRLAVLAAAISGFVLLETQVGLPGLTEVQDYFNGLGWIALPAFAVFYASATLLPLPKAVCTIAGGAIFGFWLGLVVVLVGAVAGSTGAFAGARWLGRDSVRGLTADRVRKVDAQIGERGFLTVLGARLLPVIPFTTINYIFGLTSVKLRAYVIATAVGIIPGTAVYVAVGAYGFSPGSWPFAITVTGLVVLTVVGTVHARRTARRPVTTGSATGEDAATP
ncbi:TVP38/TMEM64 family protein [Aeromicrobium sp. A1-2]|uniref:TVP38/TMEM64 family protein n=1 Tax=Aeromicrobium sp. A1-2 TaxID=2107713 RepID=UPI000E5059DA|nr:TVP38/TMEM64 family protein [Aeromicrobium sp. A1-2]AXT86289.1 TVP38/TMEM64 family protein [Aeromicrobium sp. A1-2]